MCCWFSQLIALTAALANSVLHFQALVIVVACLETVTVAVTEPSQVSGPGLVSSIKPLFRSLNVLLVFTANCSHRSAGELGPPLPGTRNCCRLLGDSHCSRHRTVASVRTGSGVVDPAVFLGTQCVVGFHS